MRYDQRPVKNADDAAFVIAADFAAACLADGDSANAARWRNVIWVERARRGLTRPRVAEKQHSAQLSLM